MAATADLFTTIHKGLRSMIYHLSGQLQTVDYADLSAAGALATNLENDFAVARSAGCVLCVLSHHAVDEESFIFPQASKSGTKLVADLIADHHELTRQELAIAAAAHELLALPSAADRIAAGVRLNQRANGLFAAYISHMNREESDLVPLMAEHFTNEEMFAMRGKIMAGMPPERMMAILGWMLPSLNATELADLLSSIRPAAPPPFFRAVTDLCAARVDPARWGVVRTRVGI